MKINKNVIASNRSNLSNRLPRRDYTSRNDKRGFTIIEMLVASSLMVTLAFAVAGLQSLFRQNELTAFNSFNNVTQANRISKGITDELRRAKSSQNGSYLFDTLEDNQIIFYSDADLDGLIDRIRYTLNGETLEKGITAPVGSPATYPVENETIRIMSENIKNSGIPVFSYFNASWPTDVANNPLDVANRLADTHVVRIFVLLNDSTNVQNQEYALDSFVKIRSL